MRPLIRAIDGGASTFGGPNRILVGAGVALEVRDADMHAAFAVAAESGSVSRSSGRRPSTASRRGPPHPERVAEASTTPSTPGAPGTRSTTSTTARTASSCVWAARAEGPDLPADRRHRRRAHDLAARDRRRRAQLGLPLLVDPRLEPDAGGAVHRRVHRRGRGVRLVHDQRRRRRRARCRSCTASAASTTSPSASSPHLRGWRDSGPVRVGNGAWDQTQLDVYGELLNALYLYREQLGELHPEIQALRCRPRRHAPPGAGRRRTRACGRCAASRATISLRRSSAGRRSTEPSSSRRSSASTQRRRSGRPSATRSARRSSSAAGARPRRPSRSRSTPTSSTPRSC